MVYDHYAPGGTAPLAKTYNYEYKSGGDYDTRRIRNRLTKVTLQKPGGTLWTLVENTYDYYGVGAAISPVPIPAMLRLHDTANYGAYMITRGNVTQSVSFGKTINFGYDYTGNLLSTSDNYGHAASQAMDENRNYAVPKSTSQGGLQSTMTWYAFHAPLMATGPNSDTLSFGYDTYARPSTRTEANGAVTTLTYSSAPHFTKATTGTRFTKTYVDGLGRTKKVENGYAQGGVDRVVSIVETVSV